MWVFSMDSLPPIAWNMLKRGIQQGIQLGKWLRPYQLYWNLPRDPGAHRGPTWGPCSKSGGTWRDFLHNYQHSLRGGAMIHMLICQYTCVFYIHYQICFFISCAIHLLYFVITYLGFHVFSKSWCLSGVSFRPVGMGGIRLTMADVSPKA
jgi:hypothetical protein